MIIPLPKHEELQEEQEENKDYARIKEYLNCPPWKCVKCKATMFGRMTYCVYCKLRLGIHTPKP